MASAMQLAAAMQLAGAVQLPAIQRLIEIKFNPRLGRLTQIRQASASPLTFFSGSLGKRDHC